MMEATGHQRMTAGMPSAVPTSTQQPHTCNCPPQAEPPVEPPPPYSAVDGGVQPGVHTELRMPDATDMLNKPPPYPDQPPPPYSQQPPPKPHIRIQSVTEQMPPSLIRQRRKRKVVRACCWTGWVLCPLLCMVGQCFREDPEDTDDKIDDPCMPWYYSINPPNNI